MAMGDGDEVRLPRDGETLVRLSRQLKGILIESKARHDELMDVLGSIRAWVRFMGVVVLLSCTLLVVAFALGAAPTSGPAMP